MHAWHAHPRLNPRYEEDTDRKYDLGNVCHTLLLGAGKRIIPLNFDDYRTKAAREAREAAIGGGRVPVLTKLLDKAHEMREAAETQMGGPMVGQGEIALCWVDGSTWYRTKIDMLAEDRLTVWDYKTTSQIMGTDTLQGKMVNDGWDIQAAMHESGLNALAPNGAGRRRHYFLVQETSRPYALFTCRLSEGSLDMGRHKLARADATWRACMLANQWPSPSRNVNVLELPAWAMRQALQPDPVTGEI
jgi:hypothetical protein